MAAQITLARIIQNLEKPLPGHETMLAIERNRRVLFDKKPDKNTKSSAVLILIHKDKDHLKISLIVRPKYDGKHGGQISLPGGKRESRDENLAQTALRETQEEIGVKAHHVKILGPLTEVFIGVSNYLVQPYVGYIDYLPDFYPDPREVERILHITLEDLSDPAKQGKKRILVQNTEMEVRGYTFEKEWVWGATALILSEFIEILKN
jgi:8-oxo-dGTP pyrophosphatase MutT (NUDIX family)